MERKSKQATCITYLMIGSTNNKTLQFENYKEVSLITAVTILNQQLFGGQGHAIHITVYTEHSRNEAKDLY